MLAFGPLGLVGYFPAKFKIRVLPPVHFDVPAEPGALLAQPGDGGVRAHPPHGPGRALRHAAHAAQRVVRLSGRAMRVLVTGLEHVLGRPRRAGARAAARRRGHRRRSTRASRASRSSAPSSCAPTRRTRSSPASCAPPQIDTILHTHLIVDSTRASGRTLHEINVIGTMNLLAAAGAPGSPVRKVVVKSSTLVYGANYQDPYFFREDMHAHPRAAHRASSARCSRSRRSSATSPRTTRTSSSRCCGSRTCSATTSTRRSRTRCGGRSSPRSSASTPACSSCTRTTSSARSCTRPRNDVPGVYNVAGDGNLPWSEVCAIVGKRRVALPPVLTAWAAEPLRMLGLWDLPPEALMLLRYGRAIDNSRFKRAGFRTGTRARARSRRSRRACGSPAPSATRNPTYRYRARRRDLLPPLARRRATGPS